MFYLLSLVVRTFGSGLQSRRELMLENLALRHQLAVLRRSAPKPRLRRSDRLLWVPLRRFWSKWNQSLVLVQPRTVVGWHRLGVRLFWRWKSGARAGRPSLDRERVTLIRQMWSGNPNWGSKRIQAELAKLGLHVSDSTVRKYRPKTRRDRRDQSWKSFLQNHAKELVSVDFFTVPTATFRVLYVFLVLAHERRKVLHFNVTDSPTAPWTAQQLTEAFAYSSPPRYLLRDRDSIYALEFQAEPPLWAWSKSSSRLAAPGRILSLSASLAPFGASAWTPRSCSMPGTYTGCCPSISSITIATGLIGHWNKIVPSRARSNRRNKAGSSLCLRLEVYTIVIREWLPEAGRYPDPDSARRKLLRARRATGPAAGAGIGVSTQMQPRGE